MSARERISTIPYRVQPAAVEAVLDMTDAVGVVGAEQRAPAVLEDTAEALGRDDALEEESGEDSGHEGLQNLEDERRELVKAVESRGRGRAAVMGAVEEAWVDVGVEEAGDGEDGGEDGDDGGEGEGKGSCVVVNDSMRRISTLYLTPSCRNTETYTAIAKSSALTYNGTVQ